MNAKTIFKQITGDRSYAWSVFATALLLIAIFVLSAIYIRPSEIQVPLRNTIFGITYTYREQWYSELVFVAFALFVSVLHTVIAGRLYVLKDRRYAIAFQWLTVAVLLIALLVFVAIFRVITSVS